MKRFRTTLTVLAALAISACLYLGARVGLAAYWMNQARQKLENNQPVASYELQKKALQLNPFFASYQRRYALINLSLASALANKTDLTPEEQTQLPQLVQQAVRAAKRATDLQPKQPLNWQVRGQVYANLLDVTPQADQYAVEAYLQAIKLDETNPDLKLKLGKVFYQNKQFTQAQKLFEAALALQPDLTEARYYLANSLRQQDQLEAAVTEYIQLLNLLEPDTEDFQQVTNELQETQQLLGSTSN